MSDHPEGELLASYALEALTPDESRLITAHLATCSVCRDELRAWQEVAASLATLAPEAQPPEGMRARVLARAIDGHRPTTTPVAPAVLPIRGPRATRWPLYAAAASLLLALGLGGTVWNLRVDRQRLEARLADAITLTEDLETGIASRDSLLNRVLGPDVQIATLAATGEAPSLRLYWDRSRGEIVLAAKRLPPAGEGRAYQLWGIGADAQPVGLGTFNTAPDGSAVIVLSVAKSASFDVSAVTVEPAAGSPAPTSTPILVGRWPSDPIQSRN